MRRRILNTLAEIGSRAVATLPAVREALQDSDPEVRRAAAEALDKINDRPHVGSLACGRNVVRVQRGCPGR